MKIKVKTAFFNVTGVHAKGEVMDVNEHDFDAALMEPIEGAPEEEPEEQPKKAPAKPGRKKKA